MAEDLEDAERALRYRAAAPHLLRELFGAEGAKRRAPRVPPAAGAAGGGHGRRDGLGERGAAAVARADGDVCDAHARADPHPASPRHNGAAGGLTVALLALLLARGGGGRSHAMPIATPVAVPSGPIVVPVAPVQPAESARPAATDTGSAVEADAGPASAKRRARLRRQHDRLARGLSIDPFAEAAARHQKP